MNFISKILTVFWKDLVIELRTKEAFSAMFVFGLLVIVIFSFAFNPGGDETLRIAPGVLWVAFTFAGILGLNRSFASERENNCLHGLIMTPVDRGVIYLGKMLSNLVFMFAFEIMLLPIFIVFFDLRIFSELPLLLLVALLGTFGFTAVGTLFSAVSINTRMREVMLPVLLLPFVLPIIIWSVESTAMILRDEMQQGFWSTLNLLLVYDIVFLTLSFVLFEYVVEE